MENLSNDLINKSRIESEEHLIYELDGWKLFEIENGKRIVTSDGVTKDILKNDFYYTENKFKQDVARGWIWIDVEYYSGYIEDGVIKTEKHKKQIQSNKVDLFKSIYHHSHDSVKNALAPILEKANKKCNQFLEQLEKLEEESNVKISFFMEGDTFGIYDSGLIVTFRIDNIDCKYSLRD
jgi:hypothetical protein